VTLEILEEIYHVLSGEISFFMGKKEFIAAVFIAASNIVFGYVQSHIDLK
jgi:hypothetical protein